MCLVPFNQQVASVPSIDWINMDNPGSLNAYLQFCHGHLGDDRFFFPRYDMLSATIAVSKLYKGNPFLAKQLYTEVAELVPHLACEEKFEDNFYQSIKKYSSIDAEEQLFNELSSAGTDRGEQIYCVSPSINTHGIAYSRYLVHEAFNMTHKDGDISHICSPEIIKHCSMRLCPELVEQFVSRLDEFCYEGVSNPEIVHTLYFRYVCKRNCEGDDKDHPFIRHLLDLGRYSPFIRVLNVKTYGQLVLEANRRNQH